MKKYIFIFFIVCLCNTIYAQSTFEKIIDTLGSTYANCVQQTFDGGFVLCGGSQFGGNDALVIKMDSTGTIEWAKTFAGPSSEGAVHIEQLPDSGYIVSALYDGGSFNAKNWLLRLDMTGDTLWTKILSAGLGKTEPFSMAISDNGNIGLTGYFRIISSFGDVYLISTDNGGVTKGSKIYNSMYGSEGHDLAITNQNEYLIIGGKATSSNSTDAYLIHTDSIGDTLWTRTYGNSQTDVGNAVDQTTDNGFIIAGLTWNSVAFKYNVYLIKTDSMGIAAWDRTYKNNAESTASSVQQTTDGGYIIAGVIGVLPTNAGNIYLIKTDSNGDTLWTRQFGGSSVDQAFFVRQTNDGGYIISGTGAINNSGGIYLIKTDSLGRVPTSTGTAELNNPFGFTVFPNPSPGKFTVQLKGIPYNNGTIEIYNLNNQIIYSCPVNKKSMLEIDLCNYPVGMYVVVLRTKEQLFTKK